jgi:hypothetical protein
MISKLARNITHFFVVQNNSTADSTGGMVDAHIEGTYYFLSNDY